MAVRRAVGMLLFLVVLAGPSAARAGSLSDVIPNLFGEGGILLAPATIGIQHQPHFLLSSEAQLTTINDSIRNQLSYYPLPSPGSGFAFRFDPALGAFTRSSEDFGPIYSQRAETIGQGKLTLGFSYSRFTPDNLDGKNLNNGELKVTFLHAPTCVPEQIQDTPCAFESDTITAKLKIGITSDVGVFSATYGILKNLDLSIAVPIIHTHMSVTGEATINHFSAEGAADHKFPNGSDSLTVHDSDSSTGIGDIVLRAKYNFLDSGPVLLATGLDLQLPSGSVDNFRGVGTPVVSPVFIASTRTFAGFSPHVNLGFHLSGDASKFNHEFYYNIGTDWTPYRLVTFVVDFLGRQIINNSRLEAGQAPGGTEIAGSTIVNAALGVKVNIWKDILGIASVLLPLNKVGLRDNATWMVGAEVTF